MYNFHLQIKLSIKDTCARLGGPLYLELGFGITMTVQKGSLQSLDWTSGLDWWTEIFCARSHFYVLL